MIQIEDKSRCCGCEACRQICPKGCISMEPDEEGFCYPHINLTDCIRCNRCEQVCPFMRSGVPRVPLKVYAARATDLEVRMRSSSGGLFTLLAEEIIGRRGGVVFGARFDQDWSVRHDYTADLEGLAPFRGSKYLQSRIGDSYERVAQFLKEGRSVLFAGTPCQVAGLVSYLGRPYEALTTVEVICHGVPSPQVWQEYLQAERLRSGEEASFTEISFRDKSQTGWRRYEIMTKLRVGSEEVKRSHFYGDNIYMRGFLYNLYLRPSCHHCMVKGGGSCSDLTLGDYWGIERVCPALDDNKGTSVVLVYSEQGQRLFDQIAPFCRTQETSYADALADNGAIEVSVPKPQTRHQFFDQMGGEEPLSRVIHRHITTPLYKRLWRIVLHPDQKLKALIGKYKRM